MRADLRLMATGWDSDSQKFRDGLGTFDLWTCSPQELDFRLCWAWQLGIAAKMQHRPGFQGLVSVDPALSRRVLTSLPPAQKASIRVARNGTFFTQDALHHFQEGETPNCIYCGAADSIRHRAFTCPHFSEARDPGGGTRLIFKHCTPETTTAAGVLLLASAPCQHQPAAAFGGWAHGPFHRWLLHRPKESRHKGCGLGCCSGLC